MQIVINMPEEMWEQVKEGYVPLGIGKHLRNGIPLPKGHGNLVDIETLIDIFWDGNSMEITKYDLSVIDPIIEADKSESEDKECR